MSENKDFDWSIYANTVLANFERIQGDIHRIRNHIEELQKSTATIQVISSELATAKRDIDNVYSELDDLMHDFSTFQIKSVQSEGVNRTEFALLSQEVKRTSTNRSILISTIIAIIVGVITGFIMKYIL